MSELEMKNNVEAKEFTDELTDEALDRDQRQAVRAASPLPARL